MRDLDPHQFAAMTALQVHKHRLGFQGNGMRNQARSRWNQRANGVEHRAIKAAAEEHRLRRRKSRQRCRRTADGDIDLVGEPEGCGIAADIRCAILARLDRVGRSAAQRPFDRNRARAGTDVPQSFARSWRQRRQRQRADGPL